MRCCCFICNERRRCKKGSNKTRSEMKNKIKCNSLIVVHFLLVHLLLISSLVLLSISSTISVISNQMGIFVISKTWLHTALSHLAFSAL